MTTAGEIRASLPDSDPLAAAMVRALVGDVPDDTIVDDARMLAHAEGISASMIAHSQATETKHAKAQRQRVRRAHLGALVTRIGVRREAQKRELPGGPIIYEALSLDEQAAIRAWIRMNESGRTAKTSAA